MRAVLGGQGAQTLVTIEDIRSVGGYVRKDGKIGIFNDEGDHHIFHNDKMNTRIDLSEVERALRPGETVTITF